MSYKIAVLSGDGIGPEVTKQSLKILDTLSKKYEVKFEYKDALVGAIAIDCTGTPLPQDTIDKCLWSDAVLFGAIGDPKYDNDPKAVVRPEQGLLELRKTLGLFTNIRPLTIFKGTEQLSPLKKEKLEGVDILMYRELTGGIYFGEKGRSEDGESAFDNCVYSKEEITRIAEMAFDSALTRKKHLTLVDKANVLETSRLWREVVQSLAKKYIDVTVDYIFVDNMAMQVIVNPAQFDVVLTENMFGDIISDEASVLAGSLGLLPSASVGLKTALFEPIHGSYPQAKGKGIANPIASILSTAMILDHLKLNDLANKVRNAVQLALEKRIYTPDLASKGDKTYTTEEVGDFIAKEIESI